MRHSYEQAMDIAAKLMSAQIQGMGCGNTLQAENIGEYYLKLVEVIRAGLEKMPD